MRTKLHAGLVHLDHHLPGEITDIIGIDGLVEDKKGSNIPVLAQQGESILILVPVAIVKGNNNRFRGQFSLLAQSKDKLLE